MRAVVVAIVLTLAALGGGARQVQARTCQSLRGPKLALAEQLFRAVHPHDCCDETLDRCLKQRKVCRLATRLRDEICRRVSFDQNAAQIKGALDRRARSMTALGARASFDLVGSPATGAPGARVTVVAYACARCQLCSRTIPQLEALVTRGSLRGRVKLHLRPFPIRGHAGATEGGLGMVAAARMGKLWPFVQLLYSGFRSFSVDKLPVWAEQAGMNRAAFSRMLSEPGVRDELVKAKKEGLRNKVDATPTLFIDGRKYVGDLDIDSVRDVLEEAADRAEEKRYQ